MELTLYIGNKNYSSWSLRPYLALKATGLPFREEQIFLRQPDTEKKIRAISPTGKVPILQDGDCTIWESLAICEYLAELAPQAKLWPEAAKARAMARSVSAEMQNGFSLVRQFMPMDLCTKRDHQSRAHDAMPDITRIKSLWQDCLNQSGGPFLFGHFTIADAMYAPVVTRFRTYGLSLTPDLQKYSQNIFSLPAMAEWEKKASREKHDFSFPILETI